MDWLQIGAAADQLPRMPAWLFEQHRQDLADTILVEGALLLLQQRLQRRQPLVLDRLRHLILGGSSRGARARRVFEREGLGKADRADEIERRLEIPIGLAGVADDEIG